jgi:hypothetical protein
MSLESLHKILVLSFSGSWKDFGGHPEILFQGSVLLEFKALTSWPLLERYSCSVLVRDEVTLLIVYTSRQHQFHSDNPGVETYSTTPPGRFPTCSPESPIPSLCSSNPSFVPIVSNDP